MNLSSISSHGNEQRKIKMWFLLVPIHFSFITVICSHSIKHYTEDDLDCNIKIDEEVNDETWL